MAYPTSTRFGTRRRLLAASAIAACLCSVQAIAYNANEAFGIPATGAAIGVPDGLASDAGWNDAAFRPLEDGSPLPASQFKAVATPSAVYLYIEASNTSFNADDSVILAFNPNGAAGNYHKLIIRPCTGTKLCTGSSSGGVPTISNTVGTLGTVNTTFGAFSTTMPSGVTVAAASAGGGATHTWSVEIKLDRATLGIPASGSFPFFMDAVTTDLALGTATNYTWPVNSPVFNPLTMADLNSADLHEPRWGGATLDASLYPGALQVMGFSNLGLDPSKISLTTPNRFAATVANGPFGSSAATIQNNVSVQFKINNIGLAPSWMWSPLPGQPMPAPATSIAAHQYKVFQTNNWTPATLGTYLTSGIAEHDFFAANPHQCVKVEVYQGGVFKFDRQYNMNFLTVNSPFINANEIATGAWLKGFPKAKSITLTEEFHNVPDGFEWESTIDGARALGNHRWQIEDLSRPSQSIASKVLVSDRLTLPLTDYTLDTARMAAGEVVKIPVTPGVPVTLLADGNARLGRQLVRPDGLDLAAKPFNWLTRTTTARRSATPYLRDAMRPGVAIGTGTLIGSADGFQTAFAIGSGTTYVPPRGVTSIQVRLAGNVQGIAGTWKMQAITAQTDSSVFSQIKGKRFLPVAANLPMQIVRGQLDTGEFIIINGHKLRVMVPMGSYGSYIYRVRAGALMPERIDPFVIDPVVRPIRPDLIRPGLVIPRQIVPPPQR